MALGDLHQRGLKRRGDLSEGLLFQKDRACHIEKRKVGDVFDLCKPLERDGRTGGHIDDIDQPGLETHQNIGDGEGNPFDPRLLKDGFGNIGILQNPDLSPFSNRIRWRSEGST